MDAWEIFCELCKRVVENHNVYLEVFVGTTGVQMQLVPLDAFEDE